MADTDLTDLELEEELVDLSTTDAVVAAVRAESRRTRNLIRRIMSDVQAHLDTDIAGLASVLTELEGEITTLKAATGTPADQLDFTKADALLAQAQAFVAPAAAATEPAATADAGTSGAAEAAAPVTEVVALAGPTSVPDGQVGAGYSATLSATGGTAPYSFSVEGLPAGLTSSSGNITGTPQTAGASTLTVTVTDASGATATSNPVLTVS